MNPLKEAQETFLSAVGDNRSRDSAMYYLVGMDKVIFDIFKDGKGHRFASLKEYAEYALEVHRLVEAHYEAHNAPLAPSSLTVEAV